MNRAAQAAAEALSRGQLARAAALYARAARHPESRGQKRVPHERSAVSLWLALGDRARARRFVQSLLRSSSRRGAAERAWLTLRLAEMHWAQGDARRARTHFLDAARRLGRRDAARFEAELGAARCELHDGAMGPAAARVAALRRAARAAGNARVEAEAMLLAARLAERTQPAAAVRRAYATAIESAAQHEVLAVECRALLAAARGALAWAHPEDAEAWAERGQRLSARLRDANAGAEAELLRAAVCLQLAERTEDRQGEGTAAGLRRDAEHRVHQALETIRRAGDPARLGEALLLAARVELLAAPARAARLAREAQAAFRAARLPEAQAQAEALRLEAGPRFTSAAPWRRLARAAGARGFGAIAAAAWLEAARRAPATARTARLHALHQAFQRGLSATAGAHTWGPRHERAGARAARLLAAEALSHAPEPKLESLLWVLAARGAESLSGGSPAERPRTLPVPCAGRTPSRVPRLPSRELPGLSASEALVVFAHIADEIHAWCVRAGRLGHHVVLSPREAWRAAAVRLEREAREARGWPDAMVPETLTARARRTLREASASIWTPLLPAVRGVSRLLVLPDPELEFLPFAALLLAADPASGPWPRALGLLTAPPAGAPPRWQMPASGTLALSSSHPDHLLGAREARGAARVLGGRVLAAERFARHGEPGRRGDPKPSPAALVRGARLLLLAAPVRYDAERPFLSRAELDGMEMHLDRPLDRPSRLSLLVLPGLEPRTGDGVAVGRVVGDIGPRGARAYAAKEARDEVAANPGRFLAAVLRESTDRVLAGTEPESRAHASPIPGAFCAGLARGDTPAEALFLAQRHAWEEGLHPVLWSGYSLWERA